MEEARMLMDTLIVSTYENFLLPEIQAHSPFSS